jgi:endoribonuclease Dicer
MTRSDIVVGTPEVFRKAFVEKSFITPSQFSLMVFDECHNAIGNSPMASIMRDAVLKLPPNQRPRILGLTASFANGSTANVATILKKRAALEVLFQASILSPIVPAEAENSAVGKTNFL